MSPPPLRVIRAFGRSGSPELLPGAPGGAWRLRSVVLKRVDASRAEIEWQAMALERAPIHGVRLILPLRSTEGQFVVEGWVATPYVEAEHAPGRWLDILDVSRRLAAGLAAVPRPAFLATRRTTWDVADRTAWGTESPDGIDRYDHITALLRLRQAMALPDQLIHGDLTGNVLFPDRLAPAVIDFTAYWRPAAFMSAIVIADALAWGGAPDDVLAGLDGGPDRGQLLVRALLFRAVAEILRQPGIDPEAAGRPFLHPIELARTLVG
jgi:uncharacterized protein (TIGR02569 family)